MWGRRRFLAASSGLVFSVLGGGRGAAREERFTWLTYALDVEQFWGNLPFVERLKRLSDAGLTRYEFGRWRAKDLDAIARRNEEVGVQAALFTAYPGLRGKWKEGLLDSVVDAAALAPKLGAVKAGVVADDRDEKLERDEQIEILVEALKEAAEKVLEVELTLILEPGRTVTSRAKPLIASPDEAASVVKAVASDRVRLAFPILPSEALSGKLPDRIRAVKEQTGYYRLVDFPPARDAESHYAAILRAIHETGYPDPIGVALTPKADPSIAIEALRKLDDAARK